MQEYTVGIIQKHLDRTGDKILPIVVPLVFYQGARNYPYSTDIFDLFGEHKNLAQEIMFKPFQLIDLSKIPDEELRQQMRLMEFVMKNIRAPDILLHINMIAPQLRTFEQMLGSDYISTTINYVIYKGNIPNPEAFFEVVTSNLSPETGEELMTVAEYLEQKGIQRGRQEGSQERAHSIAQNLLKYGLSNAEISEATGLPIQEIIQLKISETEAE